LLYQICTAVTLSVDAAREPDANPHAYGSNITIHNFIIKNNELPKFEQFKDS